MVVDGGERNIVRKEIIFVEWWAGKTVQGERKGTEERRCEDADLEPGRQVTRHGLSEKNRPRNSRDGSLVNSSECPIVSAPGNGSKFRGVPTLHIEGRGSSEPA